MSKQVQKIHEIAYHRNGVCGRGFYAVRFQGSEEIYDGLNFLATVTDTKSECYVISTDRLETHGVAFGRNSWRGDHFEDELRAAIKKWEDSR